MACNWARARRIDNALIESMLLHPRPGDEVQDGRGRRGIYVGDVPGVAGREGWGIFKVGEIELRSRDLRLVPPNIDDIE